MKRTGVFMAAVLAAAMVMAQEKTAVVNMMDLVRFHPSRERDRKLLQETEKEYQGKIDKLRDRLDQLRGDFEKAVKEARNPALNEKARVEAEDKAMKHRDVLNEAENDMRGEAQKLQQSFGELNERLLRQVTGDIREMITKYAQENKLTYVLDSAAVTYFDPKLEVTEDVLKRMGVDPKVRKEAKEKAEKDAKEKEAAGKK